MPDFTSIIDFFNRRRQKKLLGDADDRGLFVKKYKAFRRLLKSNNEVLLTISDMQEKASGGFLFDRVYVQSAYDTISAGIIRIIDNLNILADSKYADLIIPYQKIDAQIRTELTKGVTIPVSNYVLPLKELNQNRIAEAGGKFAYLGELMNSLDAPVPPGFVITTYAYQSFARQNHVEDFMLQKADDFHSRDYAKVEHACREVQTLVINGEVKTELSEAIVEACEALQKEVGHEDLRLALRSSALHEDVRASFAGQLRSVLNVPPASIFEEYKAILASQFTPRAILYYLDQGFAVEEMAMAVGALAMVDAKVSGIVYSKDPRCPNEDIVLVSAVWGLGSYAVEGKVLTTNYCIFGDKGDQIECEEDARQEVMLVPDPSTGTKEMHVPAECFDTLCLNDEQVHRLVAFARRAEKHLGKPQDMEWAFDQSDQLYLLQSRPLRLSIQKPPSDRKRPRQVEGQKILIEKGTIACPGTAQGRVCVMTDPGIEPAVGRKFVDRNYIIVARNFCNVSTRLGFHFSTVEAYLGDDENLNYISFIYTGGGADHGRKNRRAGLISRLLQKYDFRVERKEDTVFGRIEGHQQAFIEDRLKVLGYLIVHTRQMDMVMYNDSMVDYYYAEMTEGIDSFMIPDTK